MPYIKQEKRKELDPFVEALFQMISTKGDLNYSMTRLLHKYIMREGKCYSTLNDAIGVVECVKQELYRTVISDYEDEKIKENGDISC